MRFEQIIDQCKELDERLVSIHLAFSRMTAEAVDEEDHQAIAEMLTWAKSSRDLIHGIRESALLSPFQDDAAYDESLGILDQQIAETERRLSEQYEGRP